MMDEVGRKLVRTAAAVLLWCSVLMTGEELIDLKLLLILAGMTTKVTIEDGKIHCKFGQVRPIIVM